MTAKHALDAAKYVYRTFTTGVVQLHQPPRRNRPLQTAAGSKSDVTRLSTRSTADWPERRKLVKTNTSDTPESDVIGTDAPAPEETMEAPEDDTLDTALVDAQTALATVQSELQVAAVANDLKAMLAASTALTVANRNVEKAQTAVDNAGFERKSAERMEFSVSLKEMIEDYVEDEIDTARMRDLGLRGIHITVDETTGKAIISITAKDAPKAKSASTREPGAPRNSAKGNWNYNGGSYASSELLLQFGGVDGAKAVDRARNPKDYGMKLSPGFDAAVKKLARDIGATRD